MMNGKSDHGGWAVRRARIPRRSANLSASSVRTAKQTSSSSIFSNSIKLGQTMERIPAPFRSAHAIAASRPCGATINARVLAELGMTVTQLWLHQEWLGTADECRHAS